MAFKAQRTAISTAVVRALERYVEPERRLFDDPFARPLCGPFLGALLSLFALRPVREWALRRSEQRAPVALGVLLCRFAYLDDVLRDALADGVRSVVILGAGLDSRACRVPGAEEARVFEVDHPSVQNVKKTRLRRNLGRLPSHVRFVPLDFETQDLAAELAAAGFDPTARTLFLCEGVSQYITRTAFHDTLRFAGGSAPGSRLAFSYVLQRFIDDRSAFPELADLWDATCRGDDPLWKSGLHPGDVADVLSGFSLRIREDVGASEHVARYLEPRGRSLGVCEIERIVLAEVQGPPAAT